MQYLKRKSMVIRTVSGAYRSGHELTPDGRAMLAAMQHEAATSSHRGKRDHRVWHGEDSLAMIGG
jgi:hypothetical protein